MFKQRSFKNGRIYREKFIHLFTNASTQPYQTSSLTPITAALLIAASVITPIWVIANPVFTAAPYISVGVVSLLMIAYILSRTRHYLSATLTLVGMLIALVITVLLTAISPIPQRMPALNFLVAAILLTSILLDLRATLLISVLTFVIVGAFFFVPGIPFDLAYSYFVFIVIIAALLMVAQAIRTNYAWQIQASESRYRQMFEANRAVKLLIDPKTGCIMDANPAAIDFYGYNRDRLKSMCIQEINTLSPEEVKAEMERARSQKKEIFTFRHRLASGEIRDVEVFSSPVVVQDKQYLYSIIMDVTERNRAEKALQDNEIYLRAILNNALFGAHFYHLEADGRLIFEGANPAADAILSIRHAEMIGQTIDEAFPGLKQTDIPEVYARIAAHGNQYRQEELSYHDHRIKGIYEIQAFATTPEHMAVFFTEISSRKQALEQAFALAVERERIKVLNQFVQNMSHELRTPLSIINSNLYVMSKTPEEDVRREYAQIGEQQIMRLTRLMDMILSMTRLDSDAPFKYQWADINLLLSDAVTDMDALRISKGLSLHFQPDPALPHLWVDADWFAEAARHLLDNAIRFTAEGGTITIRTYVQDVYVCVEIRDTGVGIPPESHERIFERFWRQDDVHSTPGFGLGLPIVQKIIERHGGIVEVESSSGQGSTFRLRLPTTTARPG